MTLATISACMRGRVYIDRYIPGERGASRPTQ